MQNRTYLIQYCPDWILILVVSQKSCFLILLIPSTACRRAAPAIKVTSKSQCARKEGTKPTNLSRNYFGSIPLFSPSLSPVVPCQKWLTFSSWFTIPWGLKKRFEYSTRCVETQEIGVRFWSCLHISDLVCFGRFKITLHMHCCNVFRRRISSYVWWHSRVHNRYYTNRWTTVLYKWDIVRGLTLVMLMSERPWKDFHSLLQAVEIRSPSFALLFSTMPRLLYALPIESESFQDVWFFSVGWLLPFLQMKGYMICWHWI